jgi:hypothetical protein
VTSHRLRNIAPCCIPFAAQPFCRVSSSWAREQFGILLRSSRNTRPRQDAEDGGGRRGPRGIQLDKVPHGESRLSPLHDPRQPVAGGSGQDGRQLTTRHLIFFEWYGGTHPIGLSRMRLSLLLSYDLIFSAYAAPMATMLPTTTNNKYRQTLFRKMSGFQSSLCSRFGCVCIQLTPAITGSLRLQNSTVLGRGNPGTYLFSGEIYCRIS